MTLTICGLARVLSPRIFSDNGDKGGSVWRYIANPHRSQTCQKSSNAIPSKVHLTTGPPQPLFSISLHAFQIASPLCLPAVILSLPTKLEPLALQVRFWP